MAGRVSIISEPRPQGNEKHRTSGNFSTTGLSGGKIRWTCPPGVSFNVWKDISVLADEHMFGNLRIQNGTVTPYVSTSGLYIANPQGATSRFPVEAEGIFDSSTVTVKSDPKPLSGEKERSSSNFALNMDYAKVICNNGISFKLKQDISVNTDRNVVYDRLKNGSCVSLKEFKNKNIYFSEPQGATSPFEVIFEPIEIKEVDTANWMSKIANKNVKLSQLSIPGTHDSGTKGISSAIAAGGGRCQNATIAQQLNDGIRFLDIRINNMQDFGESLENAVLNSAATVATKMNASGRKESLVISHGAFFCGITLGQVLEDCERFLKAHPGEVIMMSVKNDGKNNNVSPYFAQYLDCYKNLFYFTDAIPTLAQARGKIVLLYRFEFTPPSQYPEVFKKSGIRLEINNNTSTYYQNKQGVFLFIDDHYEKESCDTKKKKVFVESALNQAMSLSVPRQSARTDGGLVVPMSIDDILFITFNSIAMHSVHTPYDYAWGTAGGVVKNIDPAMNRWLKEYLINNYGNRRLGVVLMDFYDRDNENNPSDLCKLIIGQQRV